MAYDVAMPLNLLVAPVEKEKLNESLFNVNFSQRSCKEKSSSKVMHIQIDRSAWDCRLSPNPYALTIYFKFVLVHGVAPERFEKC
jgi:hypothetical protein